MPNRGQQLGRRRPFVRRPGIGKFPPWDGMNREGDAASCPANAFRMLINTRVDDSEIWSRGGQTAINPDDELDGCVGGVFPPEFEPPDQAFTRLLIATKGDSSTQTHLFIPNENDEVTTVASGFHEGVVFLYWSGERLLACRFLSADGGSGLISEYRIDTSTGESVIQNVGAPAGINLAWETYCGAVVLADGSYFLVRYDSDATATEAVRLERIVFGTSDFEFSEEEFADPAAGSFPDLVTAAVDGRVIWVYKYTSVAVLSVRSPATETFTHVNFPSGFEVISSDGTGSGVGTQSFAWHAGKLYIGGSVSGELSICAYDPVANTISTVRTITGSVGTHCPMAVHKGVLYFAYGVAGGAERVGMLRKGVWTNVVASFSAPADIYDLCSFQDHLYMTKDTFLLRCSDPSVDPTFETFFTGDEALGAMVAVP